MSRRAVAGSNERPAGEFAFDTEPAEKTEISPGVYIVTHRPASLSAKLLPPLFLIILGAGLTFAFGGKEEDADGDGVNDKLDKCPGTAAGCKVDATGCPSKIGSHVRPAFSLFHTPPPTAPK